jgi:hypothetical protein
VLRLLCVMRDHGLLSPHRPRRSDAGPHDRKVWLFGVAEGEHALPDGTNPA